MLVFTYACLGSCDCNTSLCKLHTVAHMNFTSLQEKVLSNSPVPYCKTVLRGQMLKGLIKKGLHNVLTESFLYRFQFP